MSFKLLLIPLIYIGMCESTGKNLAAITWEHAVNDRTKLENTLKTDKQMLEADVQLSSIIGVGPIMAHPPATTSDLSLDQFLNIVTDFNAKNKSARKGVKLDFKSIDAFNASLPILRNSSIIDQVPLWLNADILAGPGNPLTTPVDAAQFLGQSKHLPAVTLSVGWTTNYVAGTSNLTYTQDDVDRMLATLKTHGINQTVTFPVRAVYAAHSFPQLSHLVANYSGASLTVWSAENDTVDVGKLRKMIVDIGVDRVYVDVPKSLMDELDLSGGTRPTLAVASALFSALFCTFYGL